VRTFACGVIGAGLSIVTVEALAVSLTVGKMQQRYPWNGLVDVDYTVSGVAADARPEDLHVEFTVHAKTNGVAFSASARTFATGLWFDMPATNGSFRVTWDAQADGFTFPTEALSADLRLVEDPISEYEADYMTVDLSTGKNGIKPVRFVRAPGLPSSVFNNDVYRTAHRGAVGICLPGGMGDGAVLQPFGSGTEAIRAIQRQRLGRALG